MHRIRLLRGVVPFVSLALLACEGATPPEPPITGPFSTTIVSGGDQVIVRGSDATTHVVVEVRDSRNRPAPGIAVSWQAPAGIGFGLVQQTTGSDGRATARLHAECTAQGGALSVAAASEAAEGVTTAVTVVEGAIVSLFPGDTVRLLDGETTTVAMSPRDACGSVPTPAPATWTSTDPGLVAVGGDAAGSRVLTGTGAGSVPVVVTTGGVTDTLPVTVHLPTAGLRSLALAPVWYGDAPGFGCGLDGAGDVHCWGGSGGTVANEVTAPRTYGARRVLAGYGFTRLTMSQAHLCALDRDGAAFCWGPNADLIGEGTPVPRTAPVPVGGDLRFTDIAAGGSHTCAITVDGEAWCWGSNANGQLGDGTTTDRLVPVRVETTHRFTGVVASARFTCALDDGGATYCWGDGPDPWGSFTAQAVTTPVLLEGAPPFKTLAAGWTNACGLTLEGEAWCWGYSPDHFGERFLPLVASGPTRIEGTGRYESIAVGAAHACAVTGAGDVDCWGANEKAQLGFHDGETASRHSAGRVTVVPLVSVFAAAGGDFTCGVNADGNVYCWGRTFAGVEHPGAIQCSWGTRASARSYECRLPRAVEEGLGPEV